jgi:hypothetical protein
MKTQPEGAPAPDVDDVRKRFDTWRSTSLSMASRPPLADRTRLYSS